MWDGKPRLSLAGVQEKLGITLRDGVYGLGDGRIASTHILKFGSREQNLVLNEYFCMKLAEAAGIPVARVELRQFGERVLLVERFDRAWAAKDHVVRRHIIDGCQALNAPPAFKYQRIVPVGPDRDSFMGPVSIESLAGFCDLCIVPAKARLQTLRWILFNLLIGNSDSHGKTSVTLFRQKVTRWRLRMILSA
jgi:serine/threonine-protein kinase HipA